MNDVQQVDTDEIEIKEGELRVWHVVNPPRQPFQVLVESVEDAKNILNFLADYDNYLGDDIIWANAQGLEIFEEGEWVEWHNEDGDDISDILREERHE